MFVYWTEAVRQLTMTVGLGVIATLPREASSRFADAAADSRPNTTGFDIGAYAHAIFEGIGLRGPFWNLTPEVSSADEVDTPEA
jgi:hypothetical protein